MVNACLPDENSEDFFSLEIEISESIKQLSGVVIGPGLGRDESTFKALVQAIKGLHNKVIVYDADSIWMLCNYTGLEYKGVVPFISQSQNQGNKIIITPNHIEATRLLSTLSSSEILPKDLDEVVNYLSDIGSDELYSVVSLVDLDPTKVELLRPLFSLVSNDIVILLKGRIDIIISIEEDLQLTLVRNKSSLNRCGGQGDILAGLCCLYGYWMTKTTNHNSIKISDAVALASAITREAAHQTFEEVGYSMTADMILKELPSIIKNVFQYR